MFAKRLSHCAGVDYVALQYVTLGLYSEFLVTTEQLKDCSSFPVASLWW